jgi:cell division septal protein FtsQ
LSLAKAVLAKRTWTLLAVLVTAAAAWGAYLWLRDISIFRVDHVEVEGVKGREAPAIRRALKAAAGRMTTLHVRDDELERAVDSFPSVRSVSTTADFPDRLTVKVDEYDPVAALATGSGRRLAVSGDGVMLHGVGGGEKLPTVTVDAISNSRVLEDPKARVLVAALGAAPEELRRQLGRAYATKHGIRVAVRDGPVIQLGAPTRLGAKWLAATRVLADQGSAGAGLIDVRLPERPAAVGASEGDAEAQL